MLRIKQRFFNEHQTEQYVTLCNIYYLKCDDKNPFFCSTFTQMYSTAATEYSSSRCLLLFPPNRKLGSFKIKVMR